MLLSEALGRAMLVKFSTNNGPFVSNDHVGVEIELEGFRHGIDQAPPLWTHHTDGSLRDGGVEFVFGGPLNGTDVENALRSLEMYLSKYKEHISLSPRTSVHVHVNALDMKVEDFRRFVGLYCVFEQMIFKAYAPSRENNHFCVPLTESDAIQIYANEWCQSFPVGIKSRNQPGRYAAFNMESLRKFGTIEFRHLHGEYHAAPLIEWINVLLSMKKYAMTSNFSGLGLLEKISTEGPIKFTQEVFPHDIAEKLLNTGRYTDMLDSVRIFQNILLCRKTYRVSPEVKKGYAPPKPEVLFYNGEHGFRLTWGSGFGSWPSLDKEIIEAKLINSDAMTVYIHPSYIPDNFYKGNKKFPKKIYLFRPGVYEKISHNKKIIQWLASEENCKNNFNWQTGEILNEKKAEENLRAHLEKPKRKVVVKPPRATLDWYEDQVTMVVDEWDLHPQPPQLEQGEIETNAPDYAMEELRARNPNLALEMLRATDIEELTRLQRRMNQGIQVVPVRNR